LCKKPPTKPPSCIIEAIESLILIKIMRGGKRPGAGRKQGFAAKSAEEARRVVAELVSREVTPIAQALIKKAVKGDIRAAQLLFDRAWGKIPTQEVAGPPPGGRPVVINYIVPEKPA
jgi:hypothetical protein